jgi:hypothetical protein
MLIISKIHNKELPEKIKKRFGNFLYNLEIFRGRLLFMLFFSRFSRYTNNLAHKRVAENPSMTI